MDDHTSVTSLADRFHIAADVAATLGHAHAYGNLKRVAYWLETAPLDVIEGVERALTEGSPCSGHGGHERGEQ
jgi:hypothetical protein